MTCPTLCDTDCETLCHEWHVPRFKREHDAADCERSQGQVLVRCASGCGAEINVTAVCNDLNCSEHTCMSCKRREEGWY